MPLGNLGKKVMEAVKNLCARDDTDESYWDQLKKCAGIWTEKYKREALEKISVDEAERKLYLIIKNVPQKGEKPQEIISSVFGLENPVFAMVREQFLLDDPSKT